MKTSNQLREKLIDELKRIVLNKTTETMQMDYYLEMKADDIMSLLDSVREEYKGMIEGLKVPEGDQINELPYE